MKMVALFRRKQGLTAEQFRDYYEHKHVPFALQLFPYFKDYRRNYVRHEPQGGEGAEGTRPRFGFDVITEITFASRADYERLAREITVPAIQEQITQDEMRFMDRSATVVLLVDEEITQTPPKPVAR